MDDSTIIRRSKINIENWVQKIRRAYKNKFEINVVYTDSKSFEARVGYVADRDNAFIIYFSEVTFPWIYHTIGLFLSDNNLFKGVGESTALASFEDLHSENYDQFSEYFQNGTIPIFLGYRTRLQQFLQEMLLTFIVSHEIGHIINGHVNVVKRIDERKMSRDFLKDNIKTLEADADRMGSSLLVTAIEDYDIFAIFPDGNREVTKYRIMAFVVFIFFFVFDKRVKTFQDFLKTSYLTPMLRLLINSMVLCSVADNVPDGSDDNLEIRYKAVTDRISSLMPEFHEILHDTVEACKKIFKNWNPLEVGDMADLANKNYKDYIKIGRTVILNWNSIYKILQDFAYYKLPPLTDFSQIAAQDEANIDDSLDTPL